MNIESFDKAKKILKIEFNPDINKFLTKKFAILDDEIFYSSDSGKLFIYNTKTENAVLEDIVDNTAKNPLISTPAIIGNVIFLVDSKSNIYKRYKDLK